jgi:DNA adenine methylase
MLLDLRPVRFAHYIEPFAGSACLFFSLQPEKALLSDVNQHLIESYEVVRDAPIRVAALIATWPADRVTYYAVRRLNPEMLDPASRAARFIYLNRLAFNSIYRTNKLGEFNVPYGSRSGPLPAVPDLQRVAAALRTTTLLSRDFEEVALMAAKNDFVYLDPPFSVRSTARFGEYGYGSFSHRDEVRLIETLCSLDRRRANVLLSYVPQILEHRALRKWTSVRVGVRYQVSAKTSSRGLREEVLLRNFS